MLFFIIHQLVPTYENEYGRRNSRVFIYGIVLYCLCYLLIVNLLLYDKISQLLYDALFWIGFILILADIAVMSYEYKYFFGRNILNEVKELNSDDNEKNWNYDEQAHKYTKVPENNIIKPIITNDVIKLKSSKSNKSQKLEKSSKSNKSQKLEKSSKSNKSSKLEKSSKSNKSSKLEKSSKSSKSSKSVK